MVAERQAVVPASVEDRVHRDPQPIRLPPDWELTDERFLEIAELNPDLLFERTADGRLHPMTWAEFLSATVATNLLELVILWARDAGGKVFGGDRGYFLPDTSAMAPDVSWMDTEQYTNYAANRGQPRFAPRFVIEVMSPSQRLGRQQDKMRDWIGNGVQLGWLIDPETRRVWIYRADGGVELLEDPSELSGEDVCSGLRVELSRVWPSE